MSRASTVGVLVLAAAVGLLLSLYGPAIPELRETFGVGGGGSALVLSAHFGGAMTGIGWWGLQRGLAARTWLALAVLLLVAGAAGIAFAPAWTVVLVAAFGLGVGFGVVVVEINVLFADGFGERATAMLNLLGACFGAGAVLGPLAVAATGGYRVPFCAGALLAVVALALPATCRATTRPAAPAEERPPVAVVAGFVALCSAVRRRGERRSAAGRRPACGPAGRRGRGGQLDGRLLGGPHRRAAAGHPAGPADDPRRRWPPARWPWPRPGSPWPTSPRSPRPPTP